MARTFGPGVAYEWHMEENVRVVLPKYPACIFRLHWPRELLYRLIDFLHTKGELSEPYTARSTALKNSSLSLPSFILTKLIAT